MESIASNKVFVAGGMPATTYVHRQQLGLEEKLKSEIFSGHQIICVTGPTKSGKSVLCKAVLSGRRSIWVHGGQVSDEEEFWRQALDALEIPEEIASTTNVGGGGKVNLGVLEMGGSAETSSTSVTRRSPKISVLSACKDKEIVLVVDDFHYIDGELQKRVVQALKSEVFDGLDVILIAVPHRAFDVVSVQKEMEGRFANVEIPRWAKEDLVKISSLGFPALNVDVDAALHERLATESYGSPLLMQRFCLKVCQLANVLAREPVKKTINIKDEDMREIFREVAEQFGYPTYKKLSEGPQARSDRIERNFRDGSGSADIYESVLRAVSMTGPGEAIHYNDIRDNLRNLLRDGDIPQKHEVSNALRNMSEIARSKIEGEPVLEWRDDTLYLTDPLLMFYMRWAKGK